MDWDSTSTTTTNATELLQMEEMRAPEIVFKSFELLAATISSSSSATASSAAAVAAAAAAAASTVSTAAATFSSHSAAFTFGGGDGGGNATHPATNLFYGNSTATYSGVGEVSATASNQIDGDAEANATLRSYPALSSFAGDIDRKYIEQINAFWLQFQPPSESAHYTIAIVYIILTILGCSGNALVIYMFIRCKSLRTPANTLVINLAISDFFMIAKSPIVVYNSFMLGPALGDLGCRVFGFLGGLTGCVSITTLTAIAIDRYHVVVYPLDPLRSTTKLRSRLTLLFVWLYSLSFAIIPALDIGLSQYVPEGYLTTCSFDYLSKQEGARLFMFIFFVGAWVIPLLMISYCYFYILKVVISANSIQSSKDKNKTELKLTAIVSGVILLWFAAWTPYAIVALLGISGNERYLTPVASMVPAIFCKMSACINPYVYAVTHPRFRMEFRRIFLGQTISMRRASTCRSTTMSVRHGGSSVRMSTRNRSSTQDLSHNPMNNNNNNELQRVSEANESSYVSSSISQTASQTIACGGGCGAGGAIASSEQPISAVSANVPMPIISSTNLIKNNNSNQNKNTREKNICDETSFRD